jgi:6-phosphogluconolactonase
MLMIDPGKIQTVDDRRDVAIPGNNEATIRFAVEHWIKTAKTAINERSRFAVALSGGSTPNTIYQMLSSETYAKQLDWSKVYLFWSDERSAPPEHPNSNFYAAMTHGLAHLPIPKNQIFRMEAEKEIERAAQEYEALIRKTLGLRLFDLVMLGVGEDGHTASLFPNTSALKPTDRLVVANHVLEKKTWRMTLTIESINQSERAVFYALGSAKQTIVGNVLQSERSSPWPASRIGTIERKALWIIDESAASLLLRPKLF